MEISESILAEIDAALDILDEAIAPRVKFTGDLAQMRQEAEDARISNILKAKRIIMDFVPGLRVRG